MDTAEIVVGEVQAARGPQVFLLAREAIGWSYKSANLHPHDEVLTSHNRSADAFDLRPKNGRRI